MVGYGEDVEKVKKLIHDTIVKQVKELAKGKDVTVQFYEMADFGLKFRVFFWTEHWDKEAGVKMEITQLVYDALNKAKINIPYPTQVVHVRK
jgi:small-conductance mechanosensitive channel